MNKNKWTQVRSNKWYKVIRNIGVLLMASLFFAIGIEVFIIPNNMNIGGLIGISQIINIYTGTSLSVGLLFILLNIPVLIAALFYFNKRFVLRSAAEVLFIGILVIILSHLNLAEKLGLHDGTNLSLIALSGGALVAGGIAATLAISGSTGGTDLLAIMLQKKFKMSFVTRLILIVEVLVITVFSIIKKDINTFFYSLTALAAYEITLELIFNGFSNAIMFEIITDNAALIVAEIDKELGRGATVFKGMGTYTKREREVVICVVRKRQESRARELVKRVDPECFAYTLPIKEVIGKGFRNINL
jgi:uncharacterized membrane-anchored protein YitT (DUF2179 family)